MAVFFPRIYRYLRTVREKIYCVYSTRREDGGVYYLDMVGE